MKLYSLLHILLRQQLVIAMDSMTNYEAVLVVEDDPQASLMMVELVISCGFQCMGIGANRSGPGKGFSGLSRGARYVC